MHGAKRTLLILFLALSAVCFALLGFVPSYVQYKLNRPPDLERALNVITQRFDRAYMIANSLIDSAAKHDFPYLFNKLSGDLGQMLSDEGIVIFLFQDDELRFWSENFEVPPVSRTPFPSIVLASNTWCVSYSIHHKGVEALILVKFKHQYLNQNQFLRNDFHPSLRFLGGFTVTGEQDDISYPVSLSLGHQEFSFSLSPKADSLRDFVDDFTSILIWFGLLSFLVCLYILFWFPLFRRYGNISTIVMVGIAVGARLAFLYWPFLTLSQWPIFSPKIFAYTWVMPSLADFLLNALIVFGLTVYAYNNLSLRNIRVNGVLGYVYPFVLVMLALLMLFLTDNLLSILVLNSTVTFETYRIFNLSLYSLLGYLSVSLWFASAVVIVHGAMRWLSWVPGWRILFIWVFSLGLSLLFFHKTNQAPSFIGVGLATLLVLSLAYFAPRGKPLSPRMVLVVVSLFSLYTVLHVSHLAREKDLNTRKVLAANLGSERDPIAEVLFPGLAKNLLADKEVMVYLEDIAVNEAELQTHIYDNYLSGYFKKYDFQVTVCLPTSNIRIGKTGQVFRCFDFFEDMLNEYGLRIPGTSFFHLNNQNGRISYLGMLEYVLPNGEEICIYLELDSKLSRELLGYPELLLEGHIPGKSLLAQYSVAKYYQGELIARSGDYNYSLVNPFPTDSLGIHAHVVEDDYDHIVYNSEGNILIVLSAPIVGLFNITASFAWVFLMFYIALFLLFRFACLPMQINAIITSFRNRIQRAMVQVLFLSLIMVAMVTIAYNIKSFERKNHDALSEKLFSAMVEVERNLIRDGDLTNEYKEFVNYYLVHLSNVFHTDINLYDTTGYIFASSRPEIFERRLLSNRIDPVAWNRINFEHSAKLVHTEQIGTMRYISAYVPLFNSQNQRVAILNLPYFTRQKEFMLEVFSVIVALINIYVLLILFTIFVGIIISNQITKPLELIRERIRKIDISKHNETIDYQGKDEIGLLVNEYNRMVIELAESAKMLAQSQRQSAWREMAKQVAHEIKNPLTPMKLSLQHLIKAKAENQPNWEQLFERFSHSLIEQIDALSNIASEFSNFAKMPIGKFRPVDLNVAVNEAVNLFQCYPDIAVMLKGMPSKPTIVLADREQLQRVLVNLLKNAVQSISKGSKGQIFVETSIEGNNWVLVCVEDNGCGIPPEKVSRIYTPNFTTKTGGMGLGLAIVKGIVEGMGGKTWFETRLGVGSKFFVRLPMHIQPSLEAQGV